MSTVARALVREGQAKVVELIDIEYYASTCPRRGYTRANPAGLFRVARSERWLAAHYLGDGEWRRSALLVHEIMSPIGPLERISFGEAMEVLRRNNARPDSLDDRARHPSAATPQSVAVMLAEGVAQD
jgi:hypothetical protein